MNSSALLTDLYQLTMANGYFKLGMHNKQVCFHQFFRRNPFGSGYTIAAGLGNVLEYLENFQFSASDIDYLSSLKSASATPVFEKSFLAYLQNLKLSCQVEAAAEGTAMFPHEPMFRVRGSILQCQLIETAILNIVNFQTLIATKASRCVQAARGKEVIDFGLRRAQGPDGALSASRAAFIGGCSATSNVLAGKRFGIPVKGTQAHSWIMAFEDEKTAFRAFAESMPDNVVLLVDTYNTVKGIANAIEVGFEMKVKGQKLLGVRLDSGDLDELSKIARSMLDRAGFYDTQVVASGDLDEHKIASLREAGAPIDAFGVGTRMITAYDEPALGGVYKLSAMQGDDGRWSGRLKVSDDADKITFPGLLQVRRFMRGNKIIKDLLYDDVVNPTPMPTFDTNNTTHFDLLCKVFETSRLLETEPLLKSRERTLISLDALGSSVVRHIEPDVFQVGVDSALMAKQAQLIQEVGS